MKEDDGVFLRPFVGKASVIKKFADQNYVGFLAKDQITAYVNPFIGRHLRSLRKLVLASGHCPLDRQELEILLVRFLDAQSARRLLGDEFTFRRPPVRGVTLGD